jgi:hypothetical protein
MWHRKKVYHSCAMTSFKVFSIKLIILNYLVKCVMGFYIAKRRHEARGLKCVAVPVVPAWIQPNLSAKKMLHKRQRPAPENFCEVQ